MFWINKIFRSRHKFHLLKKVIRLRSFRFLREIYYSIKHPEEKDLLVLRENSISSTKQVVFVDVGAFEGDFSEKFFSVHPQSKAYLIEPVPDFVQTLERRFEKRDFVVIPRALTVDGQPITLSDEGASSSSHDGEQVREYSSISVENLFKIVIEPQIDLFQINCEGAEYEILPEIISGGHITRINAINIQFHYLNVTNILRRRKIVKQLRRTHELIWNVPFIWERWEIK
jgi:FkbM family methyltransferase